MALSATLNTMPELTNFVMVATRSHDVTVSKDNCSMTSRGSWATAWEESLVVSPVTSEELPPLLYSNRIERA